TTAMTMPTTTAADANAPSSRRARRRPGGAGRTGSVGTDDMRLPLSVLAGGQECAFLGLRSRRYDHHEWKSMLVMLKKALSWPLPTSRRDILAGQWSNRPIDSTPVRAPAAPTP